MLSKGLSFICVLAAVVAGLAAPARAQECKVPRVLVVLDKSSSMLDPVGEMSKWEIARKALTSVLTDNDARLELGLMVFPSPDKCGPGTLDVQIGPLHAQAVLAKLGDPPPKTGFYTPMAQTLEAAAKVTGLTDSAYDNHVLLITDGWQYCGDNDPSSDRFWPVQAVKQLNELGITTHVVGFGDGVDALTLNNMVVSANTKVSATCDVDGADPVGTNNCYYQAGNLQQLMAVLTTLTQQIQSEKCDGKDNDCDGQIDEGCACIAGQQRNCTNQCGPGQQTCDANGNWQACSAGGPSAEVCDGKDNDCDGTVDGPNAQCANGGVCIDAVCQLPESSSGCDCQLDGDTPTAALLLPGMLLALALLRRRRRG